MKVTAKMVSAVETLARSDPRLVMTTAEFDSDPWLFNCDNGTVEMKTGLLREHRWQDYITKLAGTSIAPHGTPCPLWIEFLERVMAGNWELIDYLQRVCGYCLTADISEHALFFLYGTGANGKSVFISILRAIFEDYHTTAPIDTFTLSYSSQHPTDMAGLIAARLVTAVETEEGKTWAEAKIKAITGGDQISARFMRQDFFSFTPQFKLMIAGNHKPRLRTVDEAIRRRFHLIPFNVTIPVAERDKKLPEKLKTELPAILRWMMDGCLKWQESGLQPPEAVIAATDDYLEAEDSIQTWIDDRCSTGNAFRDTSANLFQSWKNWADAAGEWVGSSKAFSEKLQGHGYPKTTIGGAKARGYKGIKVTRIEGSQSSGWQGGWENR